MGTMYQFFDHDGDKLSLSEPTKDDPEGTVAYLMTSSSYVYMTVGAVRGLMSALADLEKSIVEKQQESEKQAKEQRREDSSSVGEYVIVRTRSSGVYVGTILAEPEQQTVLLADARRIISWTGTDPVMHVSKLATVGMENAPCKFSYPVDTYLTEVLQLIFCTEEAKRSLQEESF